MYGPVIDGDLVQDSLYKLLNADHFVPVPTIFGDDTNGGTGFAPRSTDSISVSNIWLRDQFPFLTLSQIKRLNTLYPETTLQYPGSGTYWRQLANVYGEMRYMCPGLFASSAFSRHPDLATKAWNYRYNVEDPQQMADGQGVPHTAETAAIWGPKYVGGPASYFPGEVNGEIVPTMQGYWTSFVRAKDPNVHRHPGSPTWEAWNEAKRNRLKMETGAMEMESVDQRQKERCEFLYSVGLGVER